MTKTDFFSVTRSAVAIQLPLVAALFYNGPGHSLPWLSVCAVVLFFWLSHSIANLNLSRVPLLLSGWLPPLAIAYVVWLFLNPLLSTYPFASSMAAMQLALLPLTLLGWLILPDEHKQMMWSFTWRLVLICGVALAVWGIVDFIVLHQRSHGPLIDANAYAALTNLFLVPVIFNFLSGSSFGHSLNNLYFKLGLVALFALAECMSLSLGGQLSLLATLPLLIWLNRSKPAFRLRCALLLLTLMSAYVLTQTLTFEPQRNIESVVLAPEQHLEKNPGVQGRLLAWNSTWKIIQDSNVLVGTGLGTYKNYYATYRDPRETATSGNLAHNDYLQGLQEGGVIQLAFFFVLMVFAPVWLLLSGIRSRKDHDGPTNNTDSAPGLVLAVSCVSLHAVVNFVHYVAPISLLTGLYLAHGWEVARRRSNRELLTTEIMQRLHPGFLKGLVIVLLAVPTTVLALDGAIFKLFGSKDPIINSFEPKHRFTVLNATLALRPGNPTPHATLIQQLLNAAETARSPEVRERYLAQAEQEGRILAAQAPALASGEFFLGKIMALKGSREDLLMAREYLERAVRRLPAATGVRLELVKVYQKLGLQEEAYRTIVGAREWIGLEFDYQSLAAFAKEAQTVSAKQKDRQTAEFWSWVYSRLVEFKIAS